MNREDLLRPSACFLSMLALLLVALCLCYVHAIYALSQDSKRETLRMGTVSVLGSADLAINNAARYIRHVSLTDVSTPFQDCPGGLDYFPGAISVNPPDFMGYVTRFEEVEP